MTIITFDYYIKLQRSDIL